MWRHAMQYLPFIKFCSSQELNGMIVQEKIVESKQQKKQIEEVWRFPSSLVSLFHFDLYILNSEFFLTLYLPTFWGGKCTKFYRKSAVKMNWSYRWFSRWAKFVFHYKINAVWKKIGNVQNCLTGKNASKNCVLRAWWDLGKEKLTPAVFGLSFVPSSRSIF